MTLFISALLHFYLAYCVWSISVPHPLTLCTLFSFSVFLAVMLSICSVNRIYDWDRMWCFAHLTICRPSSVVPLFCVCYYLLLSIFCEFRFLANAFWLISVCAIGGSISAFWLWRDFHPRVNWSSIYKLWARKNESKWFSMQFLVRRCTCRNTLGFSANSIVYARI